MTAGDDFLRSVLGDDSTLFDDESGRPNDSRVEDYPSEATGSVLGVDVEALLQRLESKKERFQQGREEASVERYRAAVGEDSIAAIVNGVGELLEVSISDDELRRSHPEGIGPRVVAAVSAARAKAGERAVEKIHEIAPKFGPE